MTWELWLAILIVYGDDVACAVLTRHVMRDLGHSPSILRIEVAI